MALNKLTATPILRSEIQGVLDNLVQHLVLISKPQQIILFGSLVTNHFTNASDIDLVLIFSTRTEMSVARKVIAKNRFPMQWPLDLLYFDKETFKSRVKVGGLCYLVQQEGEVLYSEEEI